MANALEFLYHLDIKKLLGDKSEFHLYLLEKYWVVDSDSISNLKKNR